MATSIGRARRSTENGSVLCNTVLRPSLTNRRSGRVQVYRKIGWVKIRRENCLSTPMKRGVPIQENCADKTSCTNRYGRYTVQPHH